MITGSGVAAFFAFSGLAPGIATKFGVSAVTMVLPMQLMAGMGRAISPVAGVVIAVSRAGECLPFEIVRRTMIPALGGIATMVLLNYALNG
jgi:DcuC family C4-dicarboxylate transporter